VGEPEVQKAGSDAPRLFTTLHPETHAVQAHAGDNSAAAGGGRAADPLRERSQFGDELGRFVQVAVDAEHRDTERELAWTPNRC
jgi:hypothetical protein